MIKKFFAVASVTTLGGFVAVSAAACASESDGSAAASLPPNAAKVSPSDPAGGGAQPAASSCKAKIKFSAAETKAPAARSVTACTSSHLSALADACTEDPNAKSCADARASAANKTCADCIFGSKSDPQWKVINLAPGEKPPVSYNQEGCIENITGVKGCGHAYMTNLSCLLQYCSSCSDASAGKSCLQEVATNDCKPYKVDEECLKAADEHQKELAGCFPATQDRKSVRDFFIYISGIACGGAKGG